MRFTRLFLTLTFCFFFSFFYGQDFTNLWQGHYSYLNIKDVSIGNDKLFAASENAIFSYDFQTNELETISSIEGLSGNLISTIYYSENFDLILVGYDTGLVEIVQNVSDEPEVFSIIDILDKQTISPGNKRINHFHEQDGLIYISTDFGISVYDLLNLEFGDTYFLGFNGTQIQINQLTVFDGVIYAATQGDAIKTAQIGNPNLIDWEEWGNLGNGSYSLIAASGNNLYAVANTNIYRLENNLITQLFSYPEVPLDMRSNDDLLTVTTKSTAFVYSNDFNLVNNFTQSEEFDIDFSTAIANKQNNIYIGTQGILSLGKAGRGILSADIAGTSDFMEIHPDGPLNNTVFSIEAIPNELYAVFGGYSNSFSFSGGLARTGVSHLIDKEWKNISFEEIKAVGSDPFYLSHISINPFNPRQVFISSHYSGLLEFNDDVPTKLYNQDNSTLEPFTADFKLTTVGAFDDDGALFVTNGRVDNSLNEFNNGNWKSYDLSSIIAPPTSNLGFSSIVIDNQRNIFLGSYAYGLVAFRRNGSSFEVDFANSEEEGYPDEYLTSLALDNNGQLWVGTNRGLRVLFNTNAFFEGEKSVNNIVILDNGIPSELLELQVINAIEVDGSNNKWIATAESGVFYISPDGQETIYQFTTDNSPLPSNVVSDIAIDSETGRVYFATNRGLVSFGSGGTSPQETLEDVYIYPNPVRPEYEILGFDDLNNINNGIKISGLTENVNVKITDIEGNLVAEAQSRINQRSSRAGYNFAIDGGTGIWNGKNLAGNIVASGVYLALISDLDSFETKVLKVMIIR